jgi:hypothetical protein
MATRKIIDLGGTAPVSTTEAIDPAEYAAMVAADLAKVQAALKSAFRDPAVVRIGTHVPEWGDFDQLRFLLSFANMLDTTKMTAAQTAARDFYPYVRDTALPKVDTLDAGQCALVDPAAAQPFAAVDGADPGWPA